MNGPYRTSGLVPPLTPSEGDLLESLVVAVENLQTAVTAYDARTVRVLGPHVTLDLARIRSTVQQRLGVFRYYEFMKRAGGL